MKVQVPFIDEVHTEVAVNCNRLPYFMTLREKKQLFCGFSHLAEAVLERTPLILAFLRTGTVARLADRTCHYLSYALRPRALCLSSYVHRPSERLNRLLGDDHRGYDSRMPLGSPRRKVKPIKINLYVTVFQPQLQCLDVSPTDA